MAFKIGSAFIQLKLTGMKTVIAGFKGIGAAARRLSQGIAGLAKSFVGLLVNALKSVITIAKLATVALVGFFVFAIKQAADAEEQMNRFRQVFSELAGEASVFGNELAKAIGRSRFEIKDALGTFQSFAVGMGLAKREAFKFSKAATQLAFDFASFNNLSDEEAIQRFISALSGSSEVMDKFGVNLKQAALSQFLIAKGFKKGAAGASEQQKAVARLSIIFDTMKRTQNAVGDAEKTIGSFTNQLKVLKSEVIEASIEIGQKLIPSALRLVKAIKANVPAIKAFAFQIVDFIVDVVENFEEFQLKTRIAIQEFIGGLLRGTGQVELFVRRVVLGWRFLVNVTLDQFALMVELVKTAFNNLVGIAEAAGTVIASGFSRNFLTEMEKNTQSFGKVIKDSFKGTKEVLDDFNKLTLRTTTGGGLAAQLDASTAALKKRLKEIQKEVKEQAGEKLKLKFGDPELPDLPGGGKKAAKKSTAAFIGAADVMKKAQLAFTNAQILSAEEKLQKVNEDQLKVQQEIAVDGKKIVAAVKDVGQVTKDLQLGFQ